MGYCKSYYNVSNKTVFKLAVKIIVVKLDVINCLFFFFFSRGEAEKGAWPGAESNEHQASNSGAPPSTSQK